MDQQQQVRVHVSKNNKHQQMINEDDDELELRRGPWTVDEDFTLINYIAHHGEGRWNSLARCAGLKRTGKSCRLRWLNYLRPDVRRGNITLEEQLLILELHSRWGNRWSKIAQHLPGRTDNEIKNYWRTRVQKHAKQLKCDVNSRQFKDTMRYLWMPRLVERIQAAAAASTEATPPPPPVAASSSSSAITSNCSMNHQGYSIKHNNIVHNISTIPENSSTVVSSSMDSFVGTPVSDLTESNYNNYDHQFNDHQQLSNINNSTNIDQDQHFYHPEVVLDHHQHQIMSSSACVSDRHQSLNGINVGIQNKDNYYSNQGMDFVDQQLINNHNWMMDGGDHRATDDDALWNMVDDVWFLQHQFNSSF